MSLRENKHVISGIILVGMFSILYHLAFVYIAPGEAIVMMISIIYITTIITAMITTIIMS